MSLRKLCKSEALEYLTPVIDGEVSEEIRLAFMTYLEHDEELRQQYLSLKRIKELVSSRCTRQKAPDKLYRSVRNYIESRRGNDDEADDLKVDHRCLPVGRVSPARADQESTSTVWHRFAAGLMLILVTLWALFLPGEQ